MPSALAALTAGAELFERRGTLVELVRYPGAAPAIRRVTEPRLEELLSRHCEFVEVARDGGEPREIPPPRWTTRGLLARGRWPELPQLEAQSNPTVSPITDRQTKEEPRMIIDDLWDCHGPSRADLKVLERIGRHRRAFEDLTPAGEHLTSIRERLLALLDVMEETLCEEGRSSPSLAEAWQRIDELEESYREDEAAAPSHSASRPKAAVVLDTNPSPDAETPLAANDSARSPKAA